MVHASLFLICALDMVYTALLLLKLMNNVFSVTMQPSLGKTMRKPFLHDLKSPAELSLRNYAELTLTNALTGTSGILATDLGRLHCSSYLHGTSALHYRSAAILAAAGNELLVRFN